VPPVTHTHALFAEQSQSILDDLMEIIGPELSMQWFSRGCAVGGGLPIIYALASELWPVEIDLGQFETALLNIAINARDAMPEGGIP
jgi:signal transduction histidine kinase